MKLHRMNQGPSIVLSTLGMILALSSSVGYAGERGPTIVAAPGKVYVGIFGGFGSPRDFTIHQYGSAFYTEALGGPLAINAFGSTYYRTTNRLFGLQVGYQGIEILPTPCAQWSIVPAVELEGFYLTNNNFSAQLINDEATRLDEHDFSANYRNKTGVFLTNAVLNFNLACYCGLHPYVGVGIGGAVIDITHGEAIQLSPPEPNLNHYNSSPNDIASTFAGQVKLGLAYDLNPNTSVFVEYRWLYLSSSHYAFGSTVYPGHPVTSSWQVKIDPQYYNIGTIGLQYKIG